MKQHGLNIIDATCPFVKKIHELVKKHYNLGYKIIIVGDENHPEVIGINGSCNNEAIITKDGSNIKDGLEKVCIVSQTTEKVENLKKVVDIVSKTAKEILTFNTICNATKERQKSAEELAKQVDLMIVIGGKNSSNSRKLFEICSQNCKNTIFIENCLELDLSKIIDDNIKAIGITAGASTPDWVIENVILKIQNNVEECTL